MVDNILQCQAVLIKVENRFRKDFGDIDALAASIAEIGLLQPIGVDSNYRLVFGERRLRACRSLGWAKIPARVVHLDSILQGELAENEFRKDFTHSERVAIGEAIERELAGRHGGNRKGEADQGGKFTGLTDANKGDTRDLAAKAAGFGNGKTYEQAKKIVHEATPELVQAMDEGRASVSAAESLLRLPRDQQAAVATGDKKTIRNAAKAVKTTLVQPSGTEHVRYLVSQMDVIARHLQREGMTPESMTQQFLDEVDSEDSVIRDRLAVALPIMKALGTIAFKMARGAQ
jgi:hypothetical protein